MSDNKKIEYSEEGQAPAIVNTDGTLDVPTFPNGEYKGETVVETLGENHGTLSPNPKYPSIEVLWYEGQRFPKGSAVYNAWVTAKAKPAESRTDYEKRLVELGQYEITSQITKEGTVEDSEERVNTPVTEGIKVERNLVNFINGLLVKGKKIEDYIEGADELDEFYKVVTNNAFTVSADDFAKASNQKPAILTLKIASQKFDLVKTSVASSVVTFENNTYIAKFTKSGSSYTGYVKEQQKFNVGDIISLGTLDLTSEGAQFEATVPTITYISIPSSGLAIIMFNTTCVIIPYTKAQNSRFVCSAIYDGNGNSMVARGKLSFTSSGIAGGKITIVFDSNFKDAAYGAGLTPPSGIIRFVEF